jgi:hypothetical protein
VTCQLRDRPPPLRAGYTVITSSSDTQATKVIRTQAPKSRMGKNEMAWLLKMSRVLPPFLKELDASFRELQESNDQAVSPPPPTPHPRALRHSTPSHS